MGPPSFTQHLPLEILQHTFGYLAVDDLKHARLVCHLFASNAAVSLFQGIYVCLESPQLHQLIDISCHPTISQHVKRITVTPNSPTRYPAREFLVRMWRNLAAKHTITVPVPHHLDLHNFKSLFDRESVQYCGGHSLSTYELGETYSQHCRAYDRERLAKHQYLDGQMLTRVLRNLPSVHEISIKDYVPKSHASHLWDEEISYWQDGFWARRVLPVLLQALAAADTNVTSFRMFPNWGGDEHVTDELGQIVHQGLTTTLNPALRNVRKFTLEKSFSEEYFMQFSMAFNETAELDAQTIDRRQYVIGRILYSMPLLEDLTIDFISLFPVYNETPFPMSLGKMRFGHLQRLSLKALDATEYELLAFLGMHADSLKHLYLDNIALYRGSWISALDRMRDTLVLDTMVFHRCSANNDAEMKKLTGATSQYMSGGWNGDMEDSEAKAGQYVKHQVDHNPLRTNLKQQINSHTELERDILMAD